LTEVLMSVGILAVGMMLIAGVFPVAIHYSTVSSERTIATIVADEAFAKIKLYGIDIENANLWPGDPNKAIDYDRTTACVDFNDVCPYYLNLYDTSNLRLSEYLYPSNFVHPFNNDEISNKKYYWQAICRRVSPLIGSRNIQVTVFVNRLSGKNLDYRQRDPWNWPALTNSEYPVPILMRVLQGVKPDELVIEDFVSFYNIDDGIEEFTFINDGYTIVDDQTGQIYRVIERYAHDTDTILLDRDFDSDWPYSATWPRYVWVIPPPVGGGRSPCIGVFQKVISF